MTVLITFWFDHLDTIADNQVQFKTYWYKCLLQIVNQHLFA